VLLKKKHEEDELSRSNIRRTYGNPEDDDEEEDGYICIFTKGAKKGEFCGKTVPFICSIQIKSPYGTECSKSHQADCKQS
jgi:hypothetical protein